MDVDLPGIDGYRVAQNFRSLEIGQSVLSVALTGHAVSEDRARTLHATLADATTRGRRHATQAE